MVVCAAVKCSNSSRIKNMRFFKFPSEGKRRQLWMDNSALPNEPGPYAKLCEIHFEESQFELHRQDGWRKLKPNAVPTLFPEPSEMPKRRKEKVRKQKQPLPSSEEDSDAEVDAPPRRKPVKRKAASPPAKKKLQKKKSVVRPPTESVSKSSQKEFVLPKKLRDRPFKIFIPRPRPTSAIVEDSSSGTEVDPFELYEAQQAEAREREAQEKQELKKENEQMRQEIQEFEKHNKAMSRVILELEKHNKAMSLKLQELDKDNKVMSKKLLDLEKQNEDLRTKLNCCFSEEQFARMEKLMALGKIERYIPGIK